jgi:hypothetical protein
MIFYSEYFGTQYQIYIDKEASDGKYCLVDMLSKDIVKRANKPEKIDKFVYGC